MRESVQCLRCGSADTRPNKDGETWTCFRCPEPFTPTPCPASGSFRISGSQGVSGATFAAFHSVGRAVSSAQSLDVQSLWLAFDSSDQSD